jgi:hypothetical protein
MTITQDLVEKLSCVLENVIVPVSGVEIITVGNKEYTVDYGDGTCDNTILVTLNGKSKSINIDPNVN